MGVPGGAGTPGESRVLGWLRVPEVLRGSQGGRAKGFGVSGRFGGSQWDSEGVPNNPPMVLRVLGCQWGS